MKKIIDLKEIIDLGRDISDGYHTFTELYDHRATLFIALCRTLDRIKTGEVHPRSIWRSKVHSDGTSYDDMFILGIGKEKGEQVTYHLPMRRWYETRFAETLEKAPDFDGHTSMDVIDRIKTI